LGNNSGRGWGTCQHRARHGDDPRHDHIRQAAQALHIGGASGLEHGARLIDHRPIGPLQEPARRFEAFLTQISIADTIEDQIVRRQRRFGVRVFRHQDGRLKGPVIEQGRRRDVATRRRDQLQDGNWRTLASVRERRLKMMGEPLVPVPARAGEVAKLGEQIAHAAMRMDVVRIGPQRRFEMNTRGFRLAAEQQQIRQVDLAVRIIRMMAHGLSEQRARGVLVAGGESERAEIVQHAEIGRRAAEQFQIVALGRFELALLAQQAGALVPGFEDIGVPLQQAVEVLKAAAVRRERQMLIHLSRSRSRFPRISCAPTDNAAGAR
jgi:hypothetical protein